MVDKAMPAKIELRLKNSVTAIGLFFPSSERLATPFTVGRLYGLITANPGVAVCYLGDKPDNSQEPVILFDPRA